MTDILAELADILITEAQTHEEWYSRVKHVLESRGWCVVGNTATKLINGLEVGFEFARPDMQLPRTTPTELTEWLESGLKRGKRHE